MGDHCHFRMLVPVTVYDATWKIAMIKDVFIKYLPVDGSYTCQLVDCLKKGRHLIIEGTLTQGDTSQLEALASYLRSKVIKGDITVEIYNNIKIIKW